MRVSATNIAIKNKQSKSVEVAPNEPLKNIDTTQFDELHMKYYSMKNILTSINDDVKEVKKKYVNMETLKEYNEQICTQLSDMCSGMITQNTPRDNSQTIDEMKRQIQDLINSTPIEIEEDPRIELLTASYETLVLDVKKLTSRVETLELQKPDESYSKQTVPKLVLRQKKQ